MSAPGSPTAEQLVLGTAQWGMPYGIANRRGQPPRRDVERILTMARESGVRVLDTARAYGQSEEIVGSLTADDSHWRIVTKVTPHLAGNASEITKAAADSLEQSRQALARETLHTVLLHRTEHLELGGGAAWRVLVRQREQGVIERIGVSVRTPEQASQLVAHPEIDTLQVPFNLLDRRLSKAGFFDRAHAEGKEIFVRSVFLQGVAFLAPEELDPCLAPLRRPLADLDRWAAENDCERAELFLRYARARGAHLVVGCESLDQLQQNLAMWKLGPLPAREIDAIEAQLPELSPAVLDPSKWRLVQSG